MEFASWISSELTALEQRMCCSNQFAIRTQVTDYFERQRIPFERPGVGACSCSWTGTLYAYKVFQYNLILRHGILPHNRRIIAQETYIRSADLEGDEPGPNFAAEFAARGYITFSNGRCIYAHKRRDWSPGQAGSHCRPGRGRQCRGCATTRRQQARKYQYTE